MTSVQNKVEMARNEEKALTLFNRWQTFKKDFHSSKVDLVRMILED